MLEPVKTYEHAGLTIEICYDESASNPRDEFENMGTIVGWRDRRHRLGDRQVSLECTDPEDIVGELRDDGARLILPIYYSEHGPRCVLSVGGPEDLADLDDSAGLVYVSAEKLRAEYSLKRISARAIRYATTVLHGEIDEYGAYLTGDVFGFVIKDPVGEHLDSCWGFYGLNYCEGRANESTEYCAQQEFAEAVEANEMACRGVQTVAA